jgi:hypothetical protein
LNKIANSLAIVYTLDELNVVEFTNENLMHVAKLAVKNFEVHYDENMQGDDENVKTWHNKHANVHDVVLNNESNPKVVTFLNPWKIASKNQWRVFGSGSTGVTLSNENGFEI